MTTIVSWNIRQRPLLDEVGDHVDVLLLQECPASIREQDHWSIYPADAPWTTGTATWRTAIAVRKTSELTVHEIPLTNLHEPVADGIAVSRSGSLTAVTLEGANLPALTVASVYARWESGNGVIYADANAHRILSDLSVLFTKATASADILVAGDWNLLYGYNEGGWPDYWKKRYDTVFDRAELLGLQYAGPRSPNGRQADPWPAELPRDSKCVPTFRSNRQTAATATRQLDHVFATRSLIDRLSVCALNKVDKWGPSDHCRIVMEVE